MSGGLTPCRQLRPSSRRVKIQKVVMQFEGLLIVMVLVSNGQNAHL